MMKTLYTILTTLLTYCIFIILSNANLLKKRNPTKYHGKDQ